jgi:hypothetical protein
MLTLLLEGSIFSNSAKINYYEHILGIQTGGTARKLFDCRSKARREICRSSKRLEGLVRLSRVRNGSKDPVFVDDVDKVDDNKEKNQISGEDPYFCFLY